MRYLKRLPMLVMAILLVVWFVVFRPTALSGPAGYSIVTGHSMEPLLHTGDLVVTQTASTYAAGDLIAFHVPAGQPGAGRIVIHRIVGGDGTTGWTTKGDNNPSVDVWHPTAANVVGRAWVQLNGVGSVLTMVQRPAFLAALAAALAAAWFYTAHISLPRRKAAQA